jgi:hypothetical protein
MGKLNLSDAAKAILTEGSKETFDANIKSKMGQRGGEKAPHGEVGKDKLPSSTVTGQQDAGEIGQSPEEKDDALPNYTKGTPSATPPGATPPVGSEKDGVGISKSTGPQDHMGRADLINTAQAAATDYAAIRDRIAGKLAPQMMQANPGATFQQYGEDMEALFSGESLSEDFKGKAVTIFEAAVTARVTELVESVEAELMTQFEEAVESYKEDLAQKVDDYLNYFTEEWYKDNQIAIEHGLRSEIVEEFVTELRDVFIKHHIDIPEEKVDVVEELVAKVEQLEGALNEEIASSVQLKKSLNEHKKVEAVHAVCEGLTQTQVEKLKSLAEGVEFTTEEEFIGKLETLIESYFKAEVKVADADSLNQEVVVEEPTQQTKTSADPLMESYARTISQTLKG